MKRLKTLLAASLLFAGLAASSATPAHAATTITTGSASVNVATVSGTGYVGVTTKKMDGVRNVPTYVGVFCDGKASGSASFNTISTTNVTHLVGFSGKTCNIKVGAGAVTGGTQRIAVSVGTPTKLSTGYTGSTVIRQPWNTRLVKQSSFFTITTPSNVRGLLGLQVTGCTSKAAKGGGGDSDATITDGCWGSMVPGGSSTVNVVVKDRTGSIVGNTTRVVSYDRHHENIAIALPKTTGWLTVTVKVTGAPILVHGPGTSYVGI